MEDLIKLRNELFTEIFEFKTKDVPKIVQFCRKLTEITGVQVCIENGSTYEYISQVYESAIHSK